MIEKHPITMVLVLFPLHERIIKASGQIKKELRNMILGNPHKERYLKEIRVLLLDEMTAHIVIPLPLIHNVELAD